MVKKICSLTLSAFASLLLTSLPTKTDQVPVSLLESLLPDNPIVLEAGARFGEDTGWMSELWPNGHIHAFEPTPVSYALLKENTKQCKNVSCYNLALAEKNGSALFYIDGGDGGANCLLKPTAWFNTNHFHGDLSKPIAVECITLDNWAKKNGISRIDFMWLDMEGHELLALQSGPEILKTVRVIFTEVNLQLFRENIPLYHEVKAWLEQQGFTEVWTEFIPNWRGNVLFVRR
jgi:FkbM family methyltransferase